MSEGGRNEPNVISRGKTPRPSSLLPGPFPFSCPAGRAGILRYPRFSALDPVAFPRGFPCLSLSTVGCFEPCE